jgi:SAM-dependent methyltransferase
VDEVQGAKTFAVTGETYDLFMGRYSRTLAEQLCDAAGVAPGDSALDVGCGPGALTAALVGRLGAGAVLACDPSPSFRAACADRCPGVRIEEGRAESIPFESGIVDHALAQLVLHFVSEPEQAVGEMARVVRPGGSVSACVWDFEEGMELLSGFWDAALSIDPAAPDEARTLRFGRPGEIADLFTSAGLDGVEESTLQVTSTYASFEELWSGFLAGVGPAGAYCVSLSTADRERLRSAVCERFGSPTAAFTLGALARAAVARVPGPR